MIRLHQLGVRQSAPKKKGAIKLKRVRERGRISNEDEAEFQRGVKKMYDYLLDRADKGLLRPTGLELSAVVNSVSAGGYLAYFQRLQNMGLIRQEVGKARRPRDIVLIKANKRIYARPQ